ncbi:hypothetical protein [Lentzea sp. NEAU-D7]|uniref:hypothetical protein n=1 Tax=Lentzea sp. NEAU-D7 TaxID=2994667 RepID=UPI00224B95A6|nr:hypothetical protein [Lentzea sp. NEAU-D7]MCX2948845.1 hypothetical protein [Lentzea sp. NEAU-D7]
MDFLDISTPLCGARSASSRFNICTTGINGRVQSMTLARPGRVKVLQNSPDLNCRRMLAPRRATLPRSSRAGPRRGGDDDDLLRLVGNEAADGLASP